MVLEIALNSTYNFSHFTDRRVKAQREEGPCLRPQTPLRLSEPVNVLGRMEVVALRAQDERRTRRLSHTEVPVPHRTQ